MADEDRRRALSGLVRQLVRPGDVVISFNWDFMIDLVLEDLDEDRSLAYTYSSSRDSIAPLKPHGSIDWFEKGKIPNDKKLLKEMQHRAMSSVPCGMGKRGEGIDTSSFYSSAYNQIGRRSRYGGSL